MAVTTADFSTITNVIYNGVEMDDLYLDGVKLWGRYLVDASYDVWIESGYTQNTTNDSGWKYNNGGTSGHYHVTYYNINSYYFNSYWASPIVTSTKTSVSKSGYTYYRGSLVSKVSDPETNDTYYYKIKRTWTTSSWIDTSHYETVEAYEYAYYY